MKKIFFCAIILIPSCIFSQAYNPLFKVHYTIANESNIDLYNFQTLITLNTATLVSAGHLNANGDDIRFSADSCSPGLYYDYWIESGMNTAVTKIWVKLPFLQAISSTDFILWYGDNTAPAQSNFNSTFPVSFISGGNDTTLSGVLQYDWFQLDAGDNIILQSNSVLEIKSQVMRLSGNIDGNGKGSIAPVSFGNGGGPGGGQLSLTAGAGGGSYAGVGGTGGMDPGDTPGMGGAVYGSINDLSNFMGSSGGTTDNAVGGNGGGGLKLTAEWLDINGSIFMNGNNGIGSIGRCGGGGSGGSIVIIGENLNLSPTCFLSAIGGGGGNGTSAANDGGGGGSGGRIKIFHGSAWSSGASLSVLGGPGGLFGSQAPGTNGSNGSYFDTTYSETPTNLEYTGTETDMVAKILGLDSVYCLNKDTVHLYALPQGGTFAGTGVTGDYFNPFNAGVGTHAISYLYNDPGGCAILYDTVWVTVLNIPTFPTATNNSPVCVGSSVDFGSNDSLATHQWSGPNGFTSNQQNPNIPSASAINSGNYSVTITNAAGCSSTVITNVVVNPLPEVTVTNNAPICLDEDLTFNASGGFSYNWAGPSGFSSAVPNPILPNTQFTSQGTYTVTVSGPGGCESTVTIDVQVNGCYADLHSEEEDFILIYPNPTYDIVWIEMTNHDMMGDVIVDLYDISGKIVMQKNLAGINSNRYNLNMEKIASGTYFITLRSNEKTESFKIIKQ
jgi:hypothetical protein